ncbi:MAG TPA: glycosyltransferase family 39 protein [Streptosporangiaceae bacterium]|nr:glycosyltransferase family 39 protein [Streptosporangiaceae bacterium]
MAGRAASGTAGPGSGATGTTAAGTGAAVTGTAPTRGQQRGADQTGGYQAGPLWARWVPPVVALALCLFKINTPSYWRDEAATMAALKRPVGDLIAMLGNVDAVHGAYYLMMWPVEHVLGPGELVMRLPSAFAVAIGAAFVAATARRLVSQWAGLAAGLIYAVLPVTSQYGQEARSYAMVMTVAVIASYMLVRVLAAEPDRQRRWLAGYAASIAALGFLNIFGLLLVPAHAVTMALYCRRGMRDPGQRKLAIGWLTAAAAGLVVASPLLVLGYLQRGQIAWLAVNTSSSGLNTVFQLSGSYLVTTTVLIMIVVSLVLSTEVSRAKRRAAWPWRLSQVSLPWLIVPPLLLIVASTVQPVYTSRYILICIPPLALIAGAAVASLGRIVGPIALAIVLISGVPMQLAQRTPSGHFDDIAAIDKVVAARSRPGDVVLYTNPNAESFGAAYSYGLGKLPNVALKQGPIPSGTLAGTNVPIAEIRKRLWHAKRVWVVEINRLNTDPVLVGLNGLPLSPTPVLDGLPLQFDNYWRERLDYLILFTHN